MKWSDLLLTAEQRALRDAQAARTEAQMGQLDASLAQQSASRNQRNLEDLEDRFFALALYTRSILQLLVDKGIVTEEEFEQRKRDLDLMDGQLDNR